MQNKILLIDGNSIMYRAYYGTAYSKQGVLRNSKGEAINAILTFNKMINKYLDRYQPTQVLVAFDAGKKTKRHDKLSSYKANRQKTPEDLIFQIPLIKRMLDLLKIDHYQLEGIEADDILASATKQYQGEFLVLTSDKDMYQLVNKHNSVISPVNNSQADKIINHENFEKELGYLPQQVPDMKGLVGDSSDNLEGVRGIGPKTALKLISQYQTLENIYQNIAAITGSTKEKLEQGKEMAFLCKELASLDYDVKIPYRLESLKVNKEIDQDILNFFEDLQIPSLVKYYQSKLTVDKEQKSADFDKLIL